MNMTSLEEFKDLAQRGTFVPVCKELVADLLTQSPRSSRSPRTPTTPFSSKAWRAGNMLAGIRSSGRIRF